MLFFLLYALKFNQHLQQIYSVGDVIAAYVSRSPFPEQFVSIFVGRTPGKNFIVLHDAEFTIMVETALDQQFTTFPHGTYMLVTIYMVVGATSPQLLVIISSN